MFPFLRRARAGRLSALAAACLLAGCDALHTPYAAPEADVPARWSEPAAATADAPNAAGADWWRSFGDAQLDRLVEDAFARNGDMAAAAIKVRQAQIQAGLAGSDELPTISASLSAAGSRATDRGEAWAKSSGATLKASYEVDLWGRLSGLARAADWEVRATEADREATALTLAGTVADLYWQLAYLNQRIASADASVAYAQRTRALVEAQYAAGAVSALEPAQARQSVASQQATRSQLVQQRAEARHALAILFDQAPGARAQARVLPQEPDTLAGFALPQVPPGVPADVLARRPDLRAAELRLRETLAEADATRVSYFPTLSLTGELGTSSSALANLLSNPVATLGAGLVLPFLQFNEMRLNTELARSEYEAAVVSYRTTLYQAFSDVEDALSAREQLGTQHALLAQSLADARTAERLYEVRYRSGAATLKEWLDAQESRREAEVSLAENQLSRLQNQVALYQALGGGV